MKKFIQMVFVSLLMLVSMSFTSSASTLTHWDGGPGITIVDLSIDTPNSQEIVVDIPNMDSIPPIDIYPYRLSIYSVAHSLPLQPEEFQYFCFTSWDGLCTFLDELTEDEIHTPSFYSFRWFIWTSSNYCIDSGTWHLGDGDIDPNPPVVVLPPEYEE
jgi:hypothetical protein